MEKIEFNSRIELSKDLQENEDVSFSTVMVDTSEAQGHSASISFNTLKDFQVKFKEDIANKTTFTDTKIEGK